MIITVLVGDHLAGGKLLRRFVLDNAAALDARGVATHSPVATSERFDVEAVADAWQVWLGRPRVRSSPQALMTETKLADSLLVQGEAGRLVEVLREHGDVQAMAFVRRMDDHICAGYVSQLRAGRTAPLRTMDLQGRGNRYNYLSRLEKWRTAVGSAAFWVHFCPSDAPASELAHTLVAGLLDPGADPVEPAFVWPPGTSSVPLSAEAAEALRRLNGAFAGGEYSLELEKALRHRAFDLLVEHSNDTAPLRLPPEAVAPLLQRYREPMVDLATCMPADEAEAFLSREAPEAAPADPQRVEALVTELAAALELGPAAASGIGRRKAASPRPRLRPMVKRARTALAEGDQARYRRVTRRLHQAMDELPESVIGQPSASAGSSSPIPHRVVQYWEPLPPPPEMEPWLASWGSVGMPGGEHRLFSFDDGLEAVREAVGPVGAQAFAEAPHPAARADLFRYAELLLHGGWYVDAEHEALLAIPDVLTWPVDHVLVRRPGGGNIPNGFIGAVPGSVLLSEVLDEACANVLQRRSPNILEMTGPGLFTRRAEAYMATSGASFVLLPANAVFADVLQAVHNEADYKVRGHWRDHDLTGGGPAPAQ